MNTFRSHKDPGLVLVETEETSVLRRAGRNRKLRWIGTAITMRCGAKAAHFAPRFTRDPVTATRAPSEERQDGR